MHVVFCVDKRFGYAREGKIPWHNAEDLKRFKHITSGPEHPILLMGRRTYESMPRKVFEGKRHACVLSQTARESEGNVTFCTSIDRAMFHCKSYEKTFVIGGAPLIMNLLRHVYTIDLTVLSEEYNCDKFLAYSKEELDMVFADFDSETVPFSAGVYVRMERRSPRELAEYHYLELMRTCLSEGVFKMDRTGVGRHSIFGHQLRFDLERAFPLLTTKKVFWKGVVEELIWFLRGDTDVKKLQAAGVHIWDGNSTRAYMDSIGITDREEGDIGPCYGWQWRHFGAEYQTAQTDYTGKGFDQIKAILQAISKDKATARAVMSAWNPPDMAKMNLPPCHVLYQFSVQKDKLCCHMYQRSADVFLGLPFNIASSALLCHIMASMLRLDVGTLHVSLGDAHVYDNHVDQCFEQLTRTPRHPCTLTILEPIEFDTLNTLEAKHFRLNDYHPHPSIKAEMAV